MSSRPLLLALAATTFLGLAALCPLPSQAAVFQAVDNTPLPQPVPDNELVAMSQNQYGYKRTQIIDYTTTPNKVYSDLFPDFEDGDPLKLSGLFKWRHEQIDPIADARTSPGYFSPRCGFSGELLMRGGNCNMSFGWYNVLDPNDPTPPAANEIYQLIPSDIETFMTCTDQSGTIYKEGTGFCPQGWDNHIPYKMSQLGWIPKAMDSGQIKSNPNYKGGYVAFALVGNPASQCKQTKHSLAIHNTKSTAGPPWITTLIWQSTVDPEGFYIGFEDLPMMPASWKDAGPGQNGSCDGDFNDFVFYVSGLSCQGGGQPCTTNLQGACSLGRTDCALGDEPPACHPIIQPGKELCDNVDNDCNGQVDDGEGLCPVGQVCDKGSCVQACNTGEFKCEGGLQCNSAGFCIDPVCLTIECPAGQACRAGKCINACDGVTCPAGQECQLGRCVDPCAGVTCTAGRVCERGLCVSSCECRGCTAPLVCGSEGRCVDTKCAGVNCTGGLKCVDGACVDPCAGVTCPGGAACVNGTCQDPNPGNGGTSSNGTAGGISIVTSGGSGVIISTSGGSANTGNVGNSTNGGGTRKSGDTSGCGCRVNNGAASSLAWLGALAVAGFLARRRSRR